MAEVRYAYWLADEKPGLEYEYALEQAVMVAKGEQGLPRRSVIIYKLVPVETISYEPPPEVVGKLTRTPL